MSLSRNIRRLQKKNEEAAPKNKRRKVLFEPLEPRVLLSADLKIAMGEGPNDLTLRLDDLTQELQVVNIADQSVVQSQLLADTGAVIIEGSEGNDKLTIDFSNPFSLPIDFDAGGESSPLGDSLEVIGDGTGSGSYTPDASRSGAGIIEFAGSTITFSGLEPVIVHGLASYTFTTPGSQDVLTIDKPLDGQNRISGSSGGSAFEAVTFYDIPSVTIDTGASDAGSPNDTITINSNLVATLLQNLTITTGAGDDTLIVHTNNFELPVNGGAFTYNGSTGTDTVNFNASSGGYALPLTLAQTLTDSTLTGADGSVVTLQGGTVEKIDDANLNVAADALKTLLNDLETLSDWVRKIAAAGDFASQLPLLFAGDQTTVNMDSALAFADAVDAVRANLHAYYNTLGSAFTLNGLETRLKNIADNVAHYAGSIVGDFAPTVVKGNTANFSISLDGASATPITVTFTRGDASPLTIDEVTGQINAAITGSALSGKILADKADGRLQFKVLDSNVVSYAISALGTDVAFSKLGLRLNETAKAVEAGLGALTGTASKLIQNASTWITIDPSTLTPKLNIKLPFDLDRTSNFGVDLGKDIRDLKGIAFDASAQLEVHTNITADIDLGLTLGVSPTFEVKVNNLAAGVQITPPVSGSNLTGDLTVGFLGVHAEGRITLDAGLALSAPITLNLSQLSAGYLGGASITQGAHTFSAEFDLSVQAGLKDGSSDFNPPGVSLTLSGADPFEPSSFEFSDFIQIGNFSDLFSFSNMSPYDMITLLKKIGSSFDDVANSDLFKAFKIPFVSGTISDALDMVAAFQKAILFDDGGDGTDNGTALVTDLNAALTRAGLGSRFLVQGDGTHVSLVATDDSISSFSASGLAAVGLNGSATSSGHVLKLTGTPVGFGVLGADGTLTLSINGGTETHDVAVTKSATADNTKVGNDVPKLVNASGAPTFRTAQEFASHLVTLLNLDPSVIAPNFDSAADELTFRLQFDANLPAVQFPVNFNLPLGAFGGFQSTGKLSLTPEAGVDLTFGIDLGAGGALADDTALADLIHPLTISTSPAFTGADLNAYAIAGRLSADALFTVSVNGNDYMVTLLASATSANTTAAALATDLNTSLANAHKLVSGTPEVAVTDLSGNVHATAVDDSSTGKHRLKLTIDHTTVTSFGFNPPSSSIVARELGFQGETSFTSAPSADVVIDAVKDVPVLIGRPEMDASFTIAIMNDGPSAVINVLNTATAENRTIIDLVNDVKNALAASAVATNITVDSQGNALVFKSSDTKDFTITSGTNAAKLGLGALSKVNDSNKYDLRITLSDNSTYNVSLANDDTIGKVKDSIESGTSSKVTVGFNADGTTLLLTDLTFTPFAGSLPNPNAAVFRVEAINGSAAGGKLGILASDAVGATDKPDGKITGAAIAGIPILDRLFIKAPETGDPDMLHAGLSIGTGAGITATANFGFVGVNLSGNGAIDAGIGASLIDPGTSPGTSGKITVAEIVEALTTDPTALLAAPAIAVDPLSLGHDNLVFALSAATGVTGFSPSGNVTFTVNDFGDPFTSTPPDISITTDASLGDLLNFDDLSFDRILAVLTEIVKNYLGSFEGAGQLGSFKIPLLNVSISDLVSNIEKFTDALQSMRTNPAGTLQTLGEKLTEALGVPTILSLDSHKFLEFKFVFNDSVRKGLNLTIPDDLLNIPGFKLSGSAGLDFTGALGLTLDFGIDLSSLSTDPNSLELPDIFVYTDTGISGTAAVSGNNLNFLAGIGPLAVSIEGGSASIGGSFGVTVIDKDGTSDGRIALTSLLSPGFLDPTLTGTASANLPLTFNGLSVGSIGIADFTDKDDDADTTEAASLATFDLDDINADLTLPDLADISLFDNLVLSAEGIDLFLGGLQDLLTGDVFGTTIPLIGDQLAKGGQFIEKLRNDFVAPFRQAMEAAKNAAENFADPSMNVVSGFLFDILGPGSVSKPGLGLLEKLDGHSGSSQEDYVDLVTNLDKYLANDPDVHLDDAMIEWDFTLGGDYNLGPNVNFNIGLPGLGLGMDGTIDVNLHWTLHLGIGFDYNEGFYLVIGNPDHPEWKDLEVGLDVDFSDGFGLTGNLAFLQLKATNDFGLYDDNDAAYGFSGTGITADFAIDLTNDTDNHLGFADIGNLDISTQVKAAAAVELGLSLGLNPGVVGSGIASGMPKVLADFILDWKLDGNSATPDLDYVDLSGIGNAMQDGLQLVEFKDLRLDVGSFVSDVLSPIVNKVKEVTEPLQPIIDVITTPIPVISDLAGSPITLLDIAASFGHVDAGLIYAIADIIDFVNSIPAPGTTDNLEIPLLGDTAFKIYDVTDSSMPTGINLADPGFKLADKADELIGKVSSRIGDLKGEIGSLSADPGSANAHARDALTSMFGGKGSAGKGDRGFSFPLFDNPSQIFYLLLGKQSDLALVEYRLPVLDFSFEYSQFFPIFGPLGVSIFGTVGLTIDMGFGYDTRGIREFIDSKATHPELLVDGFYLTDLDTSGNDVPELTFYGGIGAAAELNLGIAEAGVAGGIGVEVDFNLHDNDQDGKVRLDELIGNIYDEAVINNDPVFAPLAIFDISGEVFAQLTAFLKIDLFFWSFEQSWNITPKITLVDFSIDFDRVPKLATKSDSGDLRLNMGPYAHARLNGDLNDIPETFTVTHKSGSAGDETVEVTSSLGGGTQTYDHIKKLMIEGGEGVDNITVNGVLVPIEISGGAGNDIINLAGSSGRAVIHGDAGDDLITGGSGIDIIYGGLGIDTIDGGGGNDIIFGDGETLGDTYADAVIAGNDSKDIIHGGADNDIIFGAGGDDEIWGDGGIDILIGDAGSVALTNGLGAWTIDWTKGVTGTMSAKNGGKDEIHGGTGDDYIFGGAGDDTLYGNGDNDRIFGEAGFDTIEGGNNDDIIFGDGWTLVGAAQLNDAYPAKGLQATTGGEKDDIKGNKGDDIIFGGGGNDTIRGQAGADTIYGGTGADLIYGDDEITYMDDGNDTIYGQSENDTIYGGGEDDLLSGDGGNDTVYGGSGTDSIYAGFGADTLDGQASRDLYYIYSRGGNATNLTTVYDTGLTEVDELTIYGTSENDVFLLRGMADAYIPTLDKLHTLIEKTYNLGGTAVLEAIEQAITKAYGPNDVPTGMLIALATQYAIDSNLSGLSALKTSIDPSYVPSPHQTGFVAKLNNGGNAIERYNYRGIEGITLNTLFGDDYVASDDTLAVFTINGGVGNDRLQIGQVFKSQRDTDSETANIAQDDIFATLEITRGWLSNGISAPMTINGGEGNDDFTVFHNKQPLTLNGGDGDDTFTVRAFALVGSTDSERARTDMKGDAGADTIRYAVNAPVGIDGGDGFDSVIVIGTEFSDDFVVTDYGVFGAGLNVTYVNIERLKVDGAEGDDRYFVLSTDANVVTEIDGGLGSDSFFVGGSPSDSPIYVTSNDLRGYNGIILHNIESPGTEYDGVRVDGIAANVADNEESFIVVTESGGVSTVTEDLTAASVGVTELGWDYDTYAVALTRSPQDDEKLTISVLAQQPAPEDDAKGFKSIEFWNPDTSAWVATLQLKFDDTNWTMAQTVMFRAISDTASEGKQFAMINHKVDSLKPDLTPGSYNGLAMRSVKVQINDDDRAGAIITRTARPLQVIEGNSTFDQEYAVVLTRPPSSDVTVTLDPYYDQVTLSGSTLSASNTLTFTPLNYSQAQFVTVTALDDGDKEGFHTDYISHTLASEDVDTTQPRTKYQLDGDPAVVGVNDIPAEKPLDTMLLADKPITDTVQVWVDTVLRPTDRFLVVGNTLVFLAPDHTTPEAISGKVEVQYNYTKPGYNNALASRQVVDIADNEVASVVVMESDGSTDVIEGGATDTYQLVLTKKPNDDVTIDLQSFNTRTGALDPDTAIPFAHFAQHVYVNGFLSTTLTFTIADWNVAQTVTVSAIDDGYIDGDETQAFVPSVPTLNKIRGPLFVEGASGSGSLSLPAPLMLPGEKNIHPTDGQVGTFTPATPGGPGAIDQMVVATADLIGVITKLNDPTIATIEDLVGKTLELTKGPGTGIVLDPSQPNYHYDRFWLINEVLDIGGGQTRLTLQNPSQVDTSKPTVTDPDNTSYYAITSLSINFFADEREQIDYMFVYDQGSVADKTGVMTSQEFDGVVKGRITGLGMGPDTFIGGFPQPGGVRYGDLEVVQVNLGTGNDNLTVDYTTISKDHVTKRDNPFYTLTMVNTGPGDDAVTVNLTDGEDGAISLNTQEGNDVVHGEGSTLPLVVFGWDGNDEIHGGAGADILFGDRGRVDYVNEDGFVVTRLGHTWEQSKVNPPVTSATTDSLTDSTASFPTTYGGLVGLSVQAISPDGHVQYRMIKENTDTTLTTDKPWDTKPDSNYFYRVSMLPEDQTDGKFRGPRIIWSIDDSIGGNDTIDGGAGTDTIIAGASNDTINGGTDNDIAMGGGGRLDLSPITGTDGSTKLDFVQTTALGIGGSDTISGNAGADILMGGAAGDSIYGDDATGSAGAADLSDTIFGDNGMIAFTRTMIATVTTTDASEATGGADTISGNGGGDYILGGVGGDTIFGDRTTPGTFDGNDVIMGDNGNLDFSLDSNFSTLDLVLTQIDASLGGIDTISGNAGSDIIFGGTAGDMLYGDNAAGIADAGDGADYLIGDNGRIDLLGGMVSVMQTTDTSEATGGVDTIRGNAGADIILGGTAGDTISGDDGADIVIGDNGVVNYNGGYGGADSNQATIDLIQATDPDSFAGIDTIYGNAGNDILIGGAGGDNISGDADSDIILGDQGTVRLFDGNITYVQDPGTPGDDFLTGGADPDLIIGGLGADKLSGLGGADILIGDEAEVVYGLGDGVTITKIDTNTLNPGNGGVDTIFGGTDDDIIIGGANDDRLDGGDQQDLIFGDNVTLERSAGSGNAIDPRFRALTGATIYGPDGLAQVAGEFVPAVQPVPGGRPTWGADWTITLDQTSIASHFGDDYIAGGAHNDEIFGQLGNDTIQGDGTIGPVTGTIPGTFILPSMTFALSAGGSLTVIAPTNYGANRTGGGLIVVTSFEGSNDGDDYIEGNGGSDVIFGNLGQDDIIGGSSSLFSLTLPRLRPDGSDLLFGGAGTDISRNHLGDASLNQAGDTIVTQPTGHSRDADMILGDNGNVFRLVGVNGANSGNYLAFNYDNYNTGSGSTNKIIPRAAQLLDYTPGGVLGAAPTSDIGAADEIHGESGDDFIYGQKGNDVLFGEGQDDDIIGGYGNDWISGGTGDDGVIGDDGRIFTSRNGTAEPLNGVAATTQVAISTPGNMQTATTNVTGQLKKAVDLTPFSQDPAWGANADEFNSLSKHTSDDIIYGGLGNDWLHGASGDDAISGAEALPAFYGVPDNPGNVLGYNSATGTFAQYFEYTPLEKIAGFLLNFDASEGPQVTDAIWGTVHTDGDDKIFGDNGNDWLVGGTGRDDLYGGWGDDLVNADDNQDTHGGLNDQPDTHPSYEDRAYGGAGRDVLIANTGGDRLIDWVGEFNSYLVPFAPFGMGTVSRTLQPQLAEFLYALSASDGGDFTRAADTGADSARNGEPFGELGVVRQQDFAWQAQTGAPRDPQAGNIPGGKRDVLRSASFNGPQATTAGGFSTADGFSPDSGKWTVQNGALQVTADSLGGDAVSVFQIGDALPGYFEVQASVLAIKPTGGWNANSYIIFDYQGKIDFKFAGLDVSTNKLVMGHRDASGWHVDEQSSVKGGLKSDTYYNMLLSVNGLNATLVIDNQMAFTHTYAPRVVAGYSYGLNWGLVGVGSNNARGAFDNITVQVLPPQLTFDQTEDFVGQPTLSFTGYTNGAWSVGGGVYTSTPNGTAAMSLLDLGPDNLNVSSYLELNAKVNAAGRAGFAFDRYADGSFKFAVIDAPADQVIIGHYTPKAGWVSDAVASKVINTGAPYTLGVSLKGTTVSVTLDGQVLLGYAFNAATVDGNFGLMATGGTASFDDVRVKTDDAAFQTLLASAQANEAVAGGGSTLTAENLNVIVDAAIIRLGDAYGLDAGQLALLDGVNVQTANLGGLILGETIGTTVLIDTDAAGYGWFIDHTPYNDTEFRVQSKSGELIAIASSPAFGDMDLLTVVMHELGHVLGFGDLNPNAGALMSGNLEAGTRRLNDSVPESPKLVQMERVTGGDVASMLRGEKQNKISWIEDFVVNVAGSDYNPFDPTDKIKISIPGIKGLPTKKTNFTHLT
jgi:Ca2+-binding RTX toxin-like protein